MALITDPDQLNQGTEITIDTAARTFDLPIAGNLSDDGVSGQGLYSFFKEEWKSDANLIPYPFPVVSITPEQIEFVEGWKPANDATRNLVRSVGWREITAAGVVEREYMGVISLGNIELTNTAYYAFSSDTSKTDFDFAGPVNQAIQTFGDSANGDFDKRSNSLTLYIRSQGKTYGSSTSTSIGLTALNYIANRFPLAEAADSKITASDATIASSAPYTQMTITYGANSQNIGGVDRGYSVNQYGNTGSAEQIYEFAQYSLRQTTDIDAGAGTKVGVLSDSLMSFAGDTLTTTKGVFISGFDSNDINRLGFTDNGGDVRTFPFVAAGTITFNSNLVADSNAIYRMFFADGYGTDSALLVNDNAGNPISGNISGRAAIAFDFDYDGSTQNGRTPSTDVDVIIIAIGLDGAQYVVALATIGKSTGQNYSLVAPLERNYSNA